MIIHNEGLIPQQPCNSPRSGFNKYMNEAVLLPVGILCKTQDV